MKKKKLSPQETIKRLRKQLREVRADEADAYRVLQTTSALLTKVANVLKGDPGPLTLHSWHDLPEIASKLVIDAQEKAMDELVQVTEDAGLYEMKFVLDSTQRDRALAFLDVEDEKALAKQRTACKECQPDDFCHLHQHGPYYGAIGGAHTFIFTPTSVGIVCRIKHGGTNEELDVSDYEKW